MKSNQIQPRFAQTWMGYPWRVRRIHPQHAGMDDDPWAMLPKMFSEKHGFSSFCPQALRILWVIKSLQDCFILKTIMIDYDTKYHWIVDRSQNSELFCSTKPQDSVAASSHFCRMLIEKTSSGWSESPLKCSLKPGFCQRTKRTKVTILLFNIAMENHNFNW